MLFEYLFTKLNNFYEICFKKHGEFVSKNYVYVIASALIVNLILSLGCFRLQFVTDVDELFTVIGSQAVKDEKYARTLFKDSDMENNFFMHQLADLGLYAEINFRVKDKSHPNILQKKYFDEIMLVHKQIISAVTYRNETSGLNYHYRDLCAIRIDDCAIEGEDLLDENFLSYLAQKRSQIVNGVNKEDAETVAGFQQFLNEDQFYISPKMKITSLKFNLGKRFRIYDKNDTDKEHNAYSDFLKLRYSLKAGDENKNISKEWEKEFIKFMKNLKSNLTTFTFSASQSHHLEFDSNTALDATLVNITFMIISMLAIILMSLNSNKVTSPGCVLPMMGILCAVFGMSSAFGFLGHIGYECCQLAFVVPFLVIGIGIDDMFIIYAAFLRSDDQWTTSERISEALKHSGISITITSLTDFVAFLVGLSAGFRSVQIFCIYAAFAIAFCYAYQLTLFTGFLVIHSNRIKANRNTFLWCIKHEKETQFEAVEQEIADNDENEVSSEKNRQCIKVILASFFKKSYAFLIKTRKGQAIVSVIFVAYLSVSIWQASQIREGLDLGDLVADDSYYKAYFHDNFDALNMSPFAILVINKTLDYSNPEFRQKIQNLIGKALKVPGIKNVSFFNWMEEYKVNLKQIEITKDYTILNEMIPSYSPFYNDVIFSKNRTKIRASRVFLQYEKMHFRSSDAEPMLALRELCRKSEIPAFVYAPVFKYIEQFAETLPSITQAFAIALMSMFLIAVLFIPDLVSTFCILVSMVSIMIGTIACMQLWGLTLSPITMILLVMNIGFCVDFSVHVTHAFIATVGKGSRGERALQACLNTGIPVFNSAISTIAGVCVLAFCKSYIFIAFFKAIFIIMCLGLLNSMLFLPVLLALVGPHWTRHREEKLIFYF